MKSSSSIIARFGQSYDYEHAQIERQKIREELTIQNQEDLAKANWWKRIWSELELGSRITSEALEVKT
jgi:hypothetical protein